ncbi:MAG: hypothetical protein GC159_02880 [Phycisphaera sp.]|nr:hypothetical protein [Phycisphaera sp.]
MTRAQKLIVLLQTFLIVVLTACLFLQSRTNVLREADNQLALRILAQTQYEFIPAEQRVNYADRLRQTAEKYAHLESLRRYEDFYLDVAQPQHADDNARDDPDQ